MARFLAAVTIVLGLWVAPAAASGLRSMEAMFQSSGEIGPELRALLAEPRLPEWRSRLDALRGLPAEEQLAQVQEFVNRAPSVPSHPFRPVSPARLLRHGGDCKGYALAKMAMLLDLGWRRDDMRLVVVGLPFHAERHLVLLVRHAGRYHVLDNLARQVFTDRYPFDEFTEAIGLFRWPQTAASRR